MTQIDRDSFTIEARERILQTDVALLNDHNVSDEVMSLMAGEHAARSEALAKCINPTLGRALLLTIAGALLAAARQVEAATVPTAEIVHV